MRSGRLNPRSRYYLAAVVSTVASACQIYQILQLSRAEDRTDRGGRGASIRSAGFNQVCDKGRMRNVGPPNKGCFESLSMRHEL
jgi:hypothetical protein